MSDVSVVLCTVPEGEAQALADQLLNEQLIACANFVGPVRSRYRWEGKIEEGSEILLVLKTETSRFARLRDRIAELHSYDVPEVLEFRADSGLPAYLSWVAESCQ